MVAGFFYTDGFRHPRGAIDAVRTFFVYETVAGHDKPFGYYFHLLALPFKSGGVWWFGTPVVLLALLGFATNIRRTVVRFLAWSAVGHFLIYSLFAYKTPWLACLPWAHVCLLAGFGIAGFSKHRLWVKTALCLLAVTASPASFTRPGRPPDASPPTTATPSPTSRPGLKSKRWNPGSSNSNRSRPATRWSPSPSSEPVTGRCRGISAPSGISATGRNPPRI